MSELQRSEMRLIAVLQRTRSPQLSVLLLASVLLLFACKPKALPTIWEFNDREATVKFSHQTSSAEIARITQSLDQDYGIILDTDGTTYLDNGKLQDLNMLIKTSAGKAGRSSARLSNLQYAYYGFRLQRQSEGQWQLVKIGNF